MHCKITLVDHLDHSLMITFRMFYKNVYSYFIRLMAINGEVAYFHFGSGQYVVQVIYHRHVVKPSTYLNNNKSCVVVNRLSKTTSMFATLQQLFLTRGLERNRSFAYSMYTRMKQLEPQVKWPPFFNVSNSHSPLESSHKDLSSNLASMSDATSHRCPVARPITQDWADPFTAMT